MKPIYIPLIFSAFILTSATPAFAQTNSVPTIGSKNQIRHQFIRNIQEIKKDMVSSFQGMVVESHQEVHINGQKLNPSVTPISTTLQATTTQTRLSSQRNRLTTAQHGLYNSFSKRITALLSYRDRIQVRLTEKKAKLPTNQQLVDAQLKLDQVANTLKVKFDNDLAKFKTQIDHISASTDPKSLLPELKTQAKAIEQDLKNIRKALVDSLRLVVTAK